MTSVRIVYTNGVEITIYAMRNDIHTFLEMLKKQEKIEDVYIN